MLPEATINWWAILACTVASMMIGYVWYSMPVFGRMWMNLIGKTEADLKGKAGPAMGITVVLSFVSAYIFAHFLDYANATSWMDGKITGWWLWLGFVFTVMWTQNIFAQRPFKLTLINSGYHLVQFLVYGFILTVWK